MATTKKAAAAPKKRAAKKVAAAPTPDPSVYEPRRDVYAFPLEEDGYFSVPVTSRRSESRGPHIVRLRQALGIPLKGVFDDDMAEAVGEYQREHDLSYTRVVDRATWESIFESKKGEGS
jgi:peptidoglycan hydrolase-like protein with peptidoglycan-binding domain